MNFTAWILVLIFLQLCFFGAQMSKALGRTNDQLENVRLHLKELEERQKLMREDTYAIEHHTRRAVKQQYEADDLEDHRI
jgi:hypothetical protein